MLLQQNRNNGWIRVVLLDSRRCISVAVVKCKAKTHIQNNSNKCRSAHERDSNIESAPDRSWCIRKSFEHNEQIFESKAVVSNKFRISVSKFGGEPIKTKFTLHSSLHVNIFLTENGLKFTVLHKCTKTIAFRFNLYGLRATAAGRKFQLLFLLLFQFIVSNF